MLDPIAGNTLQYTGTLTPAGSQFPAGTTFSVTSNYPSESPTSGRLGFTSYSEDSGDTDAVIKAILTNN